jgi:superfamily I DNA/RNA helicase
MVASGTSPGDILVLAQRGVIGTPIFERLIEENVPVRSYYAEAELDAEEAQQRFALLKLFVDRNDRVALRWLLGLGSNNWRAPAYRRVRERCEADNSSPWQVLSAVADGNYMISHVGRLVARFTEIRDQLEDLEQCPNIHDVLDLLFPDGFAHTRELREVSLAVLNEIGSEDRVQFLSELISAIAAPEIPTEIEDVRIMSLHKSKGLSAPVTIIVGCVEGLLPMRPDPSLSEAAQEAYLEEQRRLFYVGISRVKASPESGRPGTLILTYSQRMPLATAMGAGIVPAGVRFGIATLNASRFVHELGPSAPSPVAC